MITATAVVLAFVLQSPFDLAALVADGDRNGDGAITRAEFLAARDRSFVRLDADRSGLLSRAELERAAPGPQARLAIGLGFSRFDTDRDSGVSRAELRAGPTLAFERADRNGDGVLDAGEIRAIRAQAW